MVAIESTWFGGQNLVDPLFWEWHVASHTTLDNGPFDERPTLISIFPIFMTDKMQAHSAISTIPHL